MYAWRAGHRDFPHDPTAQQLYGDREFEAYRRLGELAGHTALDMIGTHRPSGADDLPPPIGNGSARTLAGRS